MAERPLGESEISRRLFLDPAVSDQGLDQQFLSISLYPVIELAVCRTVRQKLDLRAMPS